MNQINLAGRIATEPRFNTTKNSRVCSFRIAVKRNYKTGEDERVDFFSIVTWGGLAEACQKHLDLGREITVNGRLRTRSYVRNNETHWTTEIIAEEVEFMGSRRNGPRKSAADAGLARTAEEGISTEEESLATEEHQMEALQA